MNANWYKRLLGSAVTGLTLLIGLAAPNAQAQVTVPPGLLPGDTYHLAFMTCGGRDAQSTNIADYDAFVTANSNLVPALVALGTTWKVIGSTATVDAITHIGVTAPVYNLAGQLMATGSADLFDGSLANPVGYTVGGGPDCGWGRPFTGTRSNGLKVIGSELGTPASCGQCVGFGDLASTNGWWVGYPGGGRSDGARPFYGISGVLTVPQPTPTTFMVTGSVTASCPAPGTSLLGITVDAFEVGEVPVNLVGTGVTDEFGAYTIIPDLPSGSSYTITVVTPLGYAAAVPEVQVSSGAAVDFSLECVSATGTPRSMGFWKHNVGVATGGRGAAQVSATTLCSYLDLIAAHFNSNVINEVIVYQPPTEPASCAAKLQVAKLLLDLKGSVGMLARAKQQLTSLLLNVAAGNIHQTAVISADGATVSQAITYCDNLIDNPTGDHERAKTIADLINNGQQVGAGLIPLSTPQIPYRLVPSTPSMPIEYSLSPNHPNPIGESSLIEFSLPERSRITLVVYDLAGREVRTLADGEWEPGRHSATLTRTSRDGRLDAGVYFVRMKAQSLESDRSFASVRKMVTTR